MASSNDRAEFGRIAESFRASLEYERDMGQTELLRDRAAPQRPEPPPLRAAPPERRDAPAEERAPARTAEPATPEGTDEGPGADLAALREDIGDCTRCPLHEGRQSIVFGEGSPGAQLVFVGEGPGHEEDIQARPFVGPAGQLLTKIIEAIGLRREGVYIANVVKCRPPRNRVPEPVEQKTCGQFLERQLEIIRPEVIVCLGATAAGYLLDTDQPVGRLRGRFHERGAVAVMPTYHPAYLLRTPAAKRPVWEDMKLVRERLGLAR